MSFLDARLPKKIVSGLSIGPRWQTTVTPMDNGGEVRNADWLYPKFEARAPMGIYTPEDRTTIRNMAMACRGQLHCFRVEDPLDNTATAEPIITIGGTNYLAKAYTFGGETVYRPIFAPTSATLTTGSASLTTGVVTGAVAGVDTWSGRFDMWMRFGSDWNAVIAQTKDVWDIELELLEVWRL